MIREALEFLVGLGKTNTVTVDDKLFSSNKLYQIDIEDPLPDAIKITTLTGLVDYVKSNIDEYYSERLLIQVVSPTQVKILSEVRADMKREFYLNCVAQVPDICFNFFMSSERFNILLQSCFVPNDHSAAILKVVGNIKEETVRGVSDDGVSQEVTAKCGIAKVFNVTVPNPVVLKPYRTFVEIEQPESKFILRMKDGPQAALFEADGGAWKNTAMQNIKKFLSKNLEGIEGIHIIS